MKSFFRMSYPYILWIGLFIVAPMIMILLYAVTRSGNGTITFHFTLENFARFLKAIGQPMSLKDLGLDTSDKGLKELVDCMMVVWGKRPEAHWPIIYDSLQKIKE